MIDWRTWLRRAPLAGVDIGDGDVRVVELARAGRGRLRLVARGAAALPPGAVVDGNIENLDLVAGAVRRACRQGGVRARLAALGLPAGLVITRKIRLPADLPEEQLEMQAEAEAAQCMPLAPDDIRLDFAVLGAAADAPGEIELMLVAAHRDKVGDRVAVAEAAGLAAVVMDLESHAAGAAFKRAAALSATSDQVVALCRIGARAIHFSAVRGGVIVHEDEQAFDGHGWPRAAARAHGMAGDGVDDSGADASADGGADGPAPLLRDAARAVAFFCAATPGAAIDRLLLAGDCAAIAGLREVVAAHTGIASAVLSPFQGMDSAPGTAGDAPAYLVACGLALRSFDR